MTIKEAFEKLTATSAAAMKNPFFVMRKLHDAFADIADKIEGGGSGSTVVVTPITQSGTKIATITVDGNDSDLYAPNATLNYSTNEVEIGTWVDGSKLYQKTVNIGSLPSNDKKDVAHGVANLNLIVSCNGFAYNSSYAFLPLPSINVDSLTFGIQLECGRTNISINTKETWMDGYSGFVTIQYTKVSN